ncbi:hypothetical protein UR09_02775 [Candidatus Nitromaritima sp. SCGC AAA799-A02]|nr:hypothetical protein UR09_02775 [Candidatus Nitromaritima sp. SCGC AAA799-A02]
MTLIVDAGERKKALVQAPAGSGKTELLIQRFLKLLGGVEYPEQILSMTFTRKAAGEMKNRILEALERGLDDTPPDSDHKRQTWELARIALNRSREREWRLLDNPSRLKVQTIDSFCAGIIRQMPILSWMGGTLAIQEKAGGLYRETAQRLLAKIESGDEVGEWVRTVVRHLDNSKRAFLQRVAQLLEKRDQWMTFFFEQFKITGKTRESSEETFTKLIEAVLWEIHSVMPGKLENLAALAGYAGTNLSTENSTHPIACLAEMKALPEPSIKHLPQWRGLAHLLLTKEGKLRKNGDRRIGIPAGATEEEKQNKKDFSQLLEALSGKEPFITLLKEAQELPDPRLSDEEWKVLEATLYLLPEMADTLRGIFSEHAQTDFTEISLAAREALGREEDPTKLLERYDMKLLHILVDEYQDTSYKQYDLLKRLTAGWYPEDGRTLFIVGDPMQSIYRFRDAEVGLFLKTREEGIGHVQFTFLALKTNFRSQKKVVDWVNQCFGAVFPKEDNQDLGAIAYSSSEAALKEAEEPGVVLHSTAGSSPTDEALKIGSLIENLRRGHSGKSIAILVRARNHLTAIVQRFHELGIRFRAEEIDPLTSRPEITDLLSLMRALLSPVDRIAWLSVLRAPWCGLSLEDLHKLCADDEKTPLWNLLNDEPRIQTLSADGKNRLARIKTTLKNSMDALPMSNFRDALEGCWIHLGGPACADPETSPDIELFFDKISDFIHSGDLTQLRSFHRILQDLYASPMVEEENPVQIMTMHKAKGLEFDFVILPGLGKTSKSEEKRLVYWMPHGDDLLVAPIEEKGGPASQIYNFLSRFDREKSDFETLRLLYVAATRAKTQLHLFGHLSGNDDPAPRKGSLLYKLWPHVSENWPTDSPPEDHSNDTAHEEPSERGPTIRRLPPDFKLPDPQPDIETGIVPELQHEPETPEFVWAGSGPRHLGTVLHRCFQNLAKNGIETWSDKRIGEFEIRLRTALRAQGLSPEMVDREVQRGNTMIRNILDHDRGRWILHSHAEARCEYPLTQIKNNTYQSRVIDRTFVDEDGVRWVIDYKTGEHLGSDLQKFFDAEKKRYRGQLEQYETLLIKNGETRPIKKALYYPMHRKLLVLK